MDGNKNISGFRLPIADFRYGRNYHWSNYGLINSDRLQIADHSQGPHFKSAIDNWHLAIQRWLTKS